MNSKSLLIVGAGGHGQVVFDAACKSKRFENINFLDSGYPKNKSSKIIGHSNDIGKFISSDVEFIVAIGDCKIRYSISNDISRLGGKLATVIHPNAVISENVTINDGVYIGVMSVLNSRSIIGKYCIINTCAIIEHDCVLGSSVHISPRVVLAGNVTIGNKSWIGIGAIVIDNINIGSNSIIGAGAVVISDISSNSKAAGVPAKNISTL